MLSSGLMFSQLWFSFLIAVGQKCLFFAIWASSQGFFTGQLASPRMRAPRGMRGEQEWSRSLFVILSGKCHLITFTRVCSLKKSQVARLVGASSHAPKVCGFDPQSGPIPRLWVQSLVRAHMEGNWSMFLSHIDISFSLSPSLPVSLKSIIKNILRWALKEFFLKVSESSQNSKKQDYTRAETSGGGVVHWDVS